MALAPSVLAQTLPLNPTVKVSRKPQSIVPPECEQGLAPATPLPPVEEASAEIAPAAAPTPPPTSDLRTRLRRVQTAAETENYDAFKSALADARAAVNAYPAGGEKQSANDVLQVYSDLERLWDYQQTNRTGAFFTAQSDDIVNALRKYPGFPRAVADATMTVSGQTIYPSRETRQFLTELTARRLGTIGIRTPTRVVQTAPPPAARPPRRAAPPPAPKHAEHTAPKHAAPKHAATKHAAHVAPKHAAHAATKHAAHAATKHAAHAATKHAITKHAVKPPVKIAEAKPRREPVKRREEPTPPPIATTTVSSGGQPPSAVPAPTTPASTGGQPTPPVPAPATTRTAAPARTETTITTAPPPSATTTTAASTTTATETTPATTSSAAPAAPAAPAHGGGMNLTFAIILIVVGIGVLIVLFRASD